MNNSEAFTYWKKPWHKWVLLVGAALQIIEVCREVEKFMIIYQQKATLFSASAWDSYARGQFSHFALSGLIIVILLGCFIIGGLAQSSKAVHVSMGILFLCISLLCSVVGFILNSIILWGAILVMSLSAGIYSLWKSRRL